MSNNVQQTVTDTAGPVVVTTLGITNNPSFWDINTFSELVATSASIVGIVWALINIGKFSVFAYKYLTKGKSDEGSN